MTRFSIAMPQDLMSRLRKYAESNSISVAAVIKMAISQFLKENAE